MADTSKGGCGLPCGYDCNGACFSEIEWLKDQVEMQRKLFAESALLAVEWERKAEKVESERDANAKWLGELLASVHRDGGHYQSKHGDSKAVADAHMIVSRLHASDESRVQVAAAYEAAAKYLQSAAVDWRSTYNELPAKKIEDEIPGVLELTPADAKAALEAYGREKVREGMQRAYELSGQYHQITHIRASILSEMETLI